MKRLIASVGTSAFGSGRGGSQIQEPKAKIALVAALVN
jgi:hypothetical protein